MLSPCHLAIVPLHLVPLPLSLSITMQILPCLKLRSMSSTPFQLWADATKGRPLETGHQLLQSTLHFSWTFPWSHDHIPPRQTTSAQRPITHCIPQCYATQPHEQATTPYESTPCRGPPSLRRHTLSYVYRAPARAPCLGTPYPAPCPHPLEYPLPSVLIHGGVR